MCIYITDIRTCERTRAEGAQSSGHGLPGVGAVVQGHSYKKLLIFSILKSNKIMIFDNP